MCFTLTYNVDFFFISDQFFICYTALPDMMFNTNTIYLSRCILAVDMSDFHFFNDCKKTGMIELLPPQTSIGLIYNKINIPVVKNICLQRLYVQLYSQNR